MTLQQLKYAIAVADTRNITEASKRVFISQPSLTAAIHELEEEMGVTIFNRSNKGVTITNEGDEFLSYARQVLEQANLLEDRYKGNKNGNTIFSVSCQHYSFAVNAFVDVIRKFGGQSYDFTLRETQTNEILDDISKMKSEIGVLYLSDKNEKVIQKMIQKNNLVFEPLFATPLHVFMSSRNPLAKKEKITLEDIGEMTGYNRTYVSTLFHQSVGIRFYDYLMRLRLQNAIKELITTDHSLTEIAMHNGFPDLKTFNSRFRDILKILPSEYRGMIEKKTISPEYYDVQSIPCTDPLVARKLKEYMEM